MKFDSRLINPQFTKDDVKKILVDNNISVSDVKTVKQFAKGIIIVKMHDGQIKTLTNLI